MLEGNYASSPDYLGLTGEYRASTAEAIFSGERVAQKHRARIAVILQAHVENGYGETAGCSVA